MGDGEFLDRVGERIRAEAADADSRMSEMDEEAFFDWCRDVLARWDQTQAAKRGEQMTAIQKLYTLEEVAEHFQLTHKTVLAWVRAGKLKGVKLGKEWRVRENDLAAFIDGLGHENE